MQLVQHLEQIIKSFLIRVWYVSTRQTEAFAMNIYELLHWCRNTVTSWHIEVAILYDWLTFMSRLQACPNCYVLKKQIEDLDRECKALKYQKQQLEARLKALQADLKTSKGNSNFCIIGVVNTGGLRRCYDYSVLPASSIDQRRLFCRKALSI